MHLNNNLNTDRVRRLDSGVNVTRRNGKRSKVEYRRTQVVVGFLRLAGVCTRTWRPVAQFFLTSKLDEGHNFVMFRFAFWSWKMFKNQTWSLYKPIAYFLNNSKHIQARGTRQYIDSSRSRNTYKATSRDALLLSDFKTSRDSHTLAYSRPPRFLNTKFFLFGGLR